MNTVNPKIYVSKGPTPGEYLVHCPEVGVEREHIVVPARKDPVEYATAFVVDRLERAVRHLKEQLP
jgi:hypothetical protein